MPPELPYLLTNIPKERPCTRCIKRNIGHLCRDEPRETAKRKSEPGSSGGENDVKPKIETVADGPLNTLHPSRSDTGLNLANFPHTQVTSNAPLVQPTPIPTPSQTAFAGGNCKFKVLALTANKELTASQKFQVSMIGVLAHRAI